MAAKLDVVGRALYRSLIRAAHKFDEQPVLKVGAPCAPGGGGGDPLAAVPAAPTPQTAGLPRKRHSEAL